MKILITITNLQKGGAERVVSRLSLEWAKTHQVTVAVFDGSRTSYPIGGELCDLKTPYYPTSHPAKKIWSWLVRPFRLAGLIRREKPDYIIGFLEEANMPLIIAALLTGNLARTQVSIRDSVDHIHWLKRILMRLLYHLPRRVITVSAQAKRQLMALGIAERRITFIPNAAPDAMSTAARLFRPKSAPRKYILAVGRLHKQKGFDLLLHAYAALPAKTTPPLVILGDGNERASLTRLADSLGLKARVILAGNVAKIAGWYAHAELFVLSSRHEGWPNVILEAMTYGCPVASFACPTGPDEIISHNKNGLLVEPNNVKALSAAIADLLADKRLSSRLASAGKMRAADFALANLAPKWLE